MNWRTHTLDRRGSINIGVMGWLGSTHLRDDEIVTVVKEITSLISYILGSCSLRQEMEHPVYKKLC